MPKLYSYDKDKWETFSDAEAQELVKKGTWVFEGDIEIPMINRDGESVQVDSNRAYDYLNNGYRYVDPQHLQKSQDATQTRLVEESNREKFDDSFKTFVTEATSAATLGGSDVAMRAIGGQSFADARQMQRQYNPDAAMFGQITGGVAGAMGLGGLAAAGRLGNYAKSLAQMGRTGAAQPMTMAGAAKLGAAEGAIFGVGDGITETAIGDTDKVAENLLVNGLLGAGFGMIGGGVAGAISKGLDSKKISELRNSVSNTVDGVVRRQVQQRLKNNLLEAAGDQIDEATLKQIDDIAFNREGRNALIKEYSENPLNMKKMLSEFDDNAKELNKVIKESQKEFDSYVRKLKKDTGDTLKAQMAESGNNMFQAAGDLNTKIQRKLIDMDGAMTEFRGSGGFLAKAANSMRARAEYLSKTEVTRPLAEKVFKRTAESVQAGMTEGQEYRVARMLKDELKAMKDSMPLSSQKGIRQLMKDLDAGILHNKRVSPGLRQLNEEYERLDDAYGKFQSFVGTKMGTQVKNPMRGFDMGSGKKADFNYNNFYSMIHDPRQYANFQELLGRISQFAPEIEMLKKGLKSAKDKSRFQQRLMENIDKMKPDKLGGDMDPKAVAAVLGQIADSTDLRKLDKTILDLKDLSGKLGDMPPISGLLAMQKALGKPISKELERFAGKEKAIELLSRIGQGGTDFAGVGERIKKVGLGQVMRRGISKMGGSVGAAYGVTAMAGLDPTYAGVYHAASAIGSPRGGGNNYRKIRALMSLDNAAHKGQQRIGKVIDKAIDRLTKVVRTGISTGAPEVVKSIDQKREEYPEVRKTVQDMQNPELSTQFAAAKLEALGDTPQIQQALMTQVIRAGQHLATKLPEDPNQMFSMTGESDYVPSDMELSEFYRHLEVVEDPAKLIERVGKTAVDRDEIETLKVVYPGLYKDLHQEVLSGIMERGSEMTYAQKLTVSQLFDIAGDPTLDPFYIKQVQESYAMTDRPQGGRPEGSRSIKIDINPEGHQSPVSKLEERN